MMIDSIMQGQERVSQVLDYAPEFPIFGVKNGGYLQGNWDLRSTNICCLGCAI